MTQSAEILFTNRVQAGQAGHREAGEEVLERLLSGTDAEGYAGDRLLVRLAREWLAAHEGGVAPTVAEAYRLRSADRVEVVLVPAGAEASDVEGVPGAWVRCLSHQVEVTRADHLAFRTSPCWRRADEAGWILFDGGESTATPRAEGKDALVLAQEHALERGAALAQQVVVSARLAGPREADVERALRATSLPKSVRDRAARGLPPRASLGSVASALGGVAAACDREEGETYARAAGRLLRTVPAAFFSARLGA